MNLTYLVPVTHKLWFVHTIQSCFVSTSQISAKTLLEKVESLKDQVVFLGGNQSMSLSSHDFSECISNSIYFLDDRWFEMDVDYLYGGHDFGFFNLDDEEIRQFYHYDLEKFDPPPFWITPNPW